MNKPADDQKLTKEHGEGNYKATEDYNRRTKEFIGSGKVEEAAAKAKPQSAEEKDAMNAAEEKGKARSKGEDSGKGMGGKTDAK